MNIQRFGVTMLVLSWAALSSASELSATGEAFAPAAVGHWSGSARIVVAWTKQTNLRVTLDIRDDGAVTGRIGDAILTRGRLKKNRGWLDQKLNVKTDYIIVGELHGPIIAAEGITRSRVKLPLNLSSGTLTGGIHTCGSKFGGKEQMILSATGLTLHRAGAR